LAFCPFSFGHCVVCSSSIYGFWLPLWYHLAIVLSVLLRFTASDYPFGIFWPLCCLYFFDLQLLITLLISFGHCVVCSSSIYGFWLPFGIFRPLCCLFFFDLRLLITPLVSFGHCVVCSSSIYGFWLPLWYLVAIVLSVLLWFTDSDYPFGIFWPLYCLFFFDLRLLITPLVSFDHCVVCPSSIYSFWLPLWLLLAIVFSVLLRFTVSDYPFGIFWPLCCLFFFDLRILITPLVSSSFSYGLFTSKRHVFKKPTDLRMGVYDLWYHESMEETDIHVHRFL
jgi:predicted nucleic acid-binding Zn ribbon protein